MAKVSIIVPTYNVEVYLRECMDSIVRQTLEDIEIICINDGSTDHSLNILQEYAKDDKRIIIIDKENGGYGIGMNIGLEKATGEYIGIVEPDDFVPLYMYEDLYSIAKKNDLDFVKADFYRFTTNEITGDRSLVYNRLDKKGEYYNRVINPSETPYVTKFILNTWSGIYKRSFIEEHKIRHNETPGASFQDNGFFWQTFIYAKRCMFIDKPYYMNRRDNPGSSVRSREKVYCMNVEYEFIRNIFMREENLELWNRFKFYYNLKKYRNYIGTIERISDEYKREYVIKISEEFKEARENKELDFNLLSAADRQKLVFLIEDPEGFYYKYAIPANEKIKELQDELDNIVNSKTYKMWKKLVQIPKTVKKKLYKK